MVIDYYVTLKLRILVILNVLSQLASNVIINVKLVKSVILNVLLVLPIEYNHRYVSVLMELSIMALVKNVLNVAHNVENVKVKLVIVLNVPKEEIKFHNVRVNPEVMTMEKVAKNAPKNAKLVRITIHV